MNYTKLPDVDMDGFDLTKTKCWQWGHNIKMVQAFAQMLKNGSTETACYNCHTCRTVFNVVRKTEYK